MTPDLSDPDRMDALYTLTARRSPALAALVSAAGHGVTGTILADADWLAARVEDTSRRWGGADSRVGATLWWYSASSVLLGAGVGVRMVTGLWPDPAAERTTVYLDGQGLVLAARSDRPLSAPGAADAWRRTLVSIIEPLARCSGAHPPALWAIASDSLANRGLDAGRALGDEGGGRDLALALGRGIGAPLPLPRFAEIGAQARSRLVCRRNSCCLIDQTGLADRCVSCPRRHPDERAELLGRPR